VEGWLQEVEALHRFFEEWIGGTDAPSGAGLDRFEGALAEGFAYVTTSGTLLDRDAIIAFVREARGAQPGLRIGIEQPRLLHACEHHVVAVYQEWQEAGEERSGRASTVVFERDTSAANGVRWLHVHETWIDPGR
jgi:hypothetical protein